jgi:cytochrome c
MDTLEVNKVIAAVLVSGIAFMVAGFVADAVVRPKELEKPVLKIAMQAAQPSQTAAAKPAPVPAITPLLAKADVAKGNQYVEQVCAACHNDTAGASAKVGPNLYDVVDRKRGSVAGFDYSSGLKKIGGEWTYHNLNLWLFDPQAVVPDTRMTFAGIKSTQTRADVVAFLRTLAPHPVPLPSAAEVEAASKAAAPAAPAPAPAQPAAAVQPAAGPSLPALLAKADVAKGKQYVEQSCAICHNYSAGAGAKIGPNLYDVVGRPRASEKGFNYSSGLKKLGGDWTYANLSSWLTDPQAVAPGTMMAFPGIKNAQTRADVIAFLRTLSAHPEPLPTPAAGKP